MSDSLKKYIIDLGYSDSELLDNLVSKFEHHEFSKKELLSKLDVVCDRLFFLKKGCVRFFIYDNKGNEVTTDFSFGPSFITSFTSYINGSPSQVGIEAVSDCSVFWTTKSKLEELFRRDCRFLEIGLKLTEKVFVISESHMLSLLTKTPLERYEYLLEMHPEYVLNIPLKYLASYLGMTPETLSRIRAKIS